MKAVLISACLLGNNCKYSGDSNRLGEAELAALRAGYRLIPVCPEMAGGLPVPREPSEILGERVLSSAGTDVSREYRRGAEIALRIARRFSCAAALLKENSPSCGSSSVYDGSFSSRLVPGSGISAALLRKSGIPVFGESEIELLSKEV